ncbi:MAG: hypothetical protein OHK93_005253 [Ramalina farinacea]|uniref:Uncharacterized protein n=1 Tax=Ramalina farinacea TaxID=258253 RepID=A0AA43QYX6_9LECA|nr:hypothetical protein [Ramalina farinacea]
MMPTQQPSYMLYLLLFSVSILPIAAQINNATCYYANGSVATSTTPCKASGTSACCDIIDLCLTNGYCLHSMVLARHACTDQSFTDPNCPQSCGKDSMPGQGKNLYQCSLTEWACTTTESANAKFQLPPGQIILRENQMPLGVSSSYYTIAADAATPAPTTAAATKAAATKAAATKAAATKAAATRATAAAATTSTASACPSKKGEMPGIGAGVGTPLAIAALVFAALWVSERRRSKSASTWREQNAYNHVLGQKVEPDNGFAYGQAMPMQHGVKPTEESWRLEAHGEDFRPEVDGQMNRFELAQSPVPR